MSLKYRNASGVETPISGLNGTSGELVPSVTYVQSGQVSIGEVAANVSGTKTVTFTTPMPDTNYLVILSAPNGNSDTFSFAVRKDQQTVNGFMFAYTNLLSVAQSNVYVYWTAFKLITNEDRALDEQAIADLQTDKQNKTLTTPLTIGGTQLTTVEGALGGLNNIVIQPYSFGYNSSHDRYIKIGTLTISDSAATKRVVLDLEIFSDSNFFGYIRLNLESRYNNINVRGETNIDIYSGVANSPAVVISKDTTNGVYVIYLDTTYSYLFVRTYVIVNSANFNIGDLSANASIDGTEVFNSTASTDMSKIAYLMPTSTVTSGSTAPITSGGVASALVSAKHKASLFINGSSLWNWVKALAEDIGTFCGQACAGQAGYPSDGVSGWRTYLGFRNGDASANNVWTLICIPNENSTDTHTYMCTVNQNTSAITWKQIV